MLPLEVPAFSTKTKDSSDSQTCLVFRNKSQNLLGDLNHLAEAIFFSEFLDVLLLEYVLTELNRIFFFLFSPTRLLNLSLNSEVVLDQDAIDVIIHVARNPHGRDLAWKFFREKWKILNAR